MKNNNKSNKPALRITKKFFVKTMNIIEKQMKHDWEFSDKLSDIYNCYVEPYDNYSMLGHLITILTETLEPHLNKCDDTMIEYFIYELDFGKKYKEGCYSVDNENVDISTTEKLYDHLLSEIDRLNNTK